MQEFAPRELVCELRRETLAMYSSNALQPAKIGATAAAVRRDDIRGDSIFWLDADQLTGQQQAVFDRLAELKRDLNRHLYFGLKDFEAHLAVYPPGTFYQKHVDRFHTDGSRFLSCILYLNPEWQAEDGGALRLYDRHNPDLIATEILPSGGTLVCFLSHELHHEVLPTRKERFSLTGWFRTQGRLI